MEEILSSPDRAAVYNFPSETSQERKKRYCFTDSLYNPTELALRSHPLHSISALSSCHTSLWTMFCTRAALTDGQVEGDVVAEVGIAALSLRDVLGTVAEDLCIQLREGDAGLDHLLPPVGQHDWGPAGTLCLAGEVGVLTQLAHALETWKRGFQLLWEDPKKTDPYGNYASFSGQLATMSTRWSSSTGPALGPLPTLEEASPDSTGPKHIQMASLKPGCPWSQGSTYRLSCMVDKTEYGQPSPVPATHATLAIRTSCQSHLG